MVLSQAWENPLRCRRQVARKSVRDEAGRNFPERVKGLAVCHSLCMPEGAEPESSMLALSGASELREHCQPPMPGKGTEGE